MAGERLGGDAQRPAVSSGVALRQLTVSVRRGVVRGSGPRDVRKAHAGACGVFFSRTAQSVWLYRFW